MLKASKLLTSSVDPLRSSDLECYIWREKVHKNSVLVKVVAALTFEI